MRRAIGAVLLASLSTTTEGGSIQYGLRLNSVSSLQWHGATLYLEDERRYATHLSAGEILEVWQGPSRGTFMVHSTKGLGILLGTDVVVAGQPQPPGAILRSARPDILWVGFTAGTQGEPRTRVREWRAGGLGRELVDVPGALADFDASADGTIAALLQAGPALLVSPSGQPRVIAPPAGLSQPVRVMLTTDGKEVSLVSAGLLCRSELARGDWRCQRFDPAQHAIVRHVVNGRPRVEDRFRE